MNGTQRTAIALLGALRTGDNRRMGDKSEFSGRRARFRAWLGRHFLAMIVVAIVLATLAYKNQWELYASSIDGNIVFDSGQCGWPAQWLDTLENVRTDAAGVDSHPLGPMAVEIRWGWLALDASIAIAAAVCTWTLFSRTQRKVRHFWQVSLPSLIALVALAGVISAIWNA